MNTHSRPNVRRSRFFSDSTPPQCRLHATIFKCICPLPYSRVHTHTLCVVMGWRGEGNLCPFRSLRRLCKYDNALTMPDEPFLTRIFSFRLILAQSLAKHEFRKKRDDGSKVEAQWIRHDLVVVRKGSLNDRRGTNCSVTPVGRR